MSENDDQILMNVSDSSALRQAEILAIRSLSDNMAQMNRTLSKLSNNMEDVRERLITQEALKLESRIEKLEDRHEKDLEKEANRIGALELAFARFSGIIVPLAFVATCITSVAITIGAQKFFGAP